MPRKTRAIMRRPRCLSIHLLLPPVPIPMSSSPSLAPRRLLCHRCTRPQRACICGWIRPIANEVELLILQHPQEVRQAKGSARLLQLSLARTRLLVGEDFVADELAALLQPEGAQQVLLLYPPTPGGLLPAPPLRPEPPLRLVLLDATWDKSLKMLLRNPLLQGLPRLALEDAPPSAYRVRKAPRAGQLSSLEAGCHALAQLEGAPQRYAPLLAAFEGFVDQLAAQATLGRRA